MLVARKAAGVTASVVLPTYNERDVIVGVVGEILDAVGDVEVLVVDDDSPDRTWEAVETAFAGDGRARALRRVGRRGLPSAIADGIAGTRGDVVVWLDADGSMPADVIPKLVAATADADVAVASRYAAGGRDARDSAARILASRAINAFGTLWLGGPVRDWTSGFVAARRSALERVPIRADHVYGDYCIDFLHRACRSGPPGGRGALRLRGAARGHDQDQSRAFAGSPPWDCATPKPSGGCDAKAGPRRIGRDRRDPPARQRHGRARCASCRGPSRPWRSASPASRSWRRR